MSDFNPLQNIKRRFFALRNGVIADTLRRAGSPFKIIFGLNLPQLADIAAELGHDPSMADTLWNNTSTRESMLLAPMLFDASVLPESKARSMISDISDVEVADVLCHRLLRHTHYAYSLAVDLASSEKDFDRYCSMRILGHFIRSESDEIERIASDETRKECRLTYGPALQIVEEIEFMREED